MTESEAKIINRRARKAFLDELRYRKTRQGAFEESFLRLDAPRAPGGRSFEVSDHGASAAAVRARCEETPLWRTLWARARRRLTRKQRRILDALLIERRTSRAAKIARVSTFAVRQFKKTFFKMHFSQCFKAWERDFG